MKLSFLGGAREIGASCCVLHAEGKEIVIDAGIRPGARQGQSFLPKFARLRQPDLVLLTHGHSDHVGALPVLRRMFPVSSIVCTAGTFEVMRCILPSGQYLLEIARETNTRAAEASYNDAELEGLLDATLVTEHGKWFAPFPDRPALRVGFFPAGHILGASVVAIEAEGRRVLFSGDFCIRDQATLPGFRNFDFEPELVVMESTYAEEEHPPRAEEISDFLENVSRVAGRGGTVLIPSFAVGRAQEILAILAEAMLAGTLPGIPIYYDGLVSRVVDLYEQFELLDLDPRVLVQRIANDTARASAAAEGPAVIVASSGTLAGGASVYYAKRLLPYPKNAIFFSGYQDEESPGHTLLALAPNATVHLDGAEIKVRAEIGKYQFSAHADRGELLGFVESQKPKVVVLNHGYWKRMFTLAEELRNSHVVWMPSTRSTFDPFSPDLGEFMRAGEVQAGRGVQQQIRRGWLESPAAVEHRRRVTAPGDLKPAGARQRRGNGAAPNAQDAHWGVLEARIGYAFADRTRLVEALTHRSYLNEVSDFAGTHNERLEFLGDAILEYLVTRELFRRYPNKTEGELTGYRAALVNATACREYADALGVEEHLLLSRGEASDTGGKARGFILANAFEAILGAMHEDGGMEPCERFVAATALHRADEVVAQRLDRDPKSEYQERVQASEGITPRYQVTNERGPDHARYFTVSLLVGDRVAGTGSGSSKAEAEAEAARAALEADFNLTLPRRRLVAG